MSSDPSSDLSLSLLFPLIPLPWSLEASIYCLSNSPLGFALPTPPFPCLSLCMFIRICRYGNVWMDMWVCLRMYDRIYIERERDMYGSEYPYVWICLSIYVSRLPAISVWRFLTRLYLVPYRVSCEFPAVWWSNRLSTLIEYKTHTMNV